jgi:hypothetical protein
MSPKPSESSRRGIWSPRPDDVAASPTDELAVEPPDDVAAGPSVFLPSPQARSAPGRRWHLYVLAILGLAACVAAGMVVAWPRLNPRRLDPVERVAESYLKALASQDSETIKRLGTVDEPPAIRSAGTVRRDPDGSRRLKGSFATLGELHGRIESEFVYDASIQRFTPKNPMGAAADTLEMLHSAKDDAEKSGLYKKMQSGDPNDIFDAAEQLGKVYVQLAEGALAPKRIVPTYKMLVESSKPPLPDDAKAFALEVAASPKDWDALLKRSFHTLKADGPFIYERAEVTASATDRLASSGDPPTRLRLSLVRFQLEGIDTGWKVVAARRILPGNDEKDAKPSAPTANVARTPLPGQPSRSLHDAPGPL